MTNSNETFAERQRRIGNELVLIAIGQLLLAKEELALIDSKLGKATVSNPGQQVNFGPVNSLFELAVNHFREAKTYLDSAWPYKSSGYYPKDNYCKHYNKSQSDLDTLFKHNNLPK